jgi:hypothetical protein
MSKQEHPFKGGVKKNPTKRHVPLVWEGMMGTVYARSPAGEVKYFHYDWDDARAHAQVADATDLRIGAARETWMPKGDNVLLSMLRQGKFALWGIPA